MAMDYPEIFRRFPRGNNNDWFLFDATEPPTEEQRIRVGLELNPKLVNELLRNVRKVISLYCSKYGELGVALSSFQDIYKDVYGCYVSYTILGFKSLYSFLQSIQGRDFLLCKTSEGVTIFQLRKALTMPEDIDDFRDIYPEEAAGPDRTYFEMNYPVLLPMNVLIDITVVDVVDPSEFYFQLRKFRPLFLSFSQDMQKYYNGRLNHYKMPRAAVLPGQICAVLHSEPIRNSDVWYRARILEAESEKYVTVHLVDTGLITRVRRTRLRFLHRDFVNFPIQAIRGTLAGVMPGLERWTRDDIEIFKELLQPECLEVRILSPYFDCGVFPVAVFIQYGSNMSINKMMVNDATAVLEPDFPIVVLIKGKTTFPKMTEVDAIRDPFGRKQLREFRDKIVPDPNPADTSEFWDPEFEKIDPEQLRLIDKMIFKIMPIPLLDEGEEVIRKRVAEEEEIRKAELLVRKTIALRDEARAWVIDENGVFCKRRAADLESARRAVVSSFDGYFDGMKRCEPGQDECGFCRRKKEMARKRAVLGRLLGLIPNTPYETQAEFITNTTVYETATIKTTACSREVSEFLDSEEVNRLAAEIIARSRFVEAELLPRGSALMGPLSESPHLIPSLWENDDKIDTQTELKNILTELRTGGHEPSLLSQIDRRREEMVEFLKPAKSEIKERIDAIAADLFVFNPIIAGVAQKSQAVAKMISVMWAEYIMLAAYELPDPNLFNPFSPDYRPTSRFGVALLNRLVNLFPQELFITFLSATTREFLQNATPVDDEYDSENDEDLQQEILEEVEEESPEEDLSTIQEKHEEEENPDAAAYHAEEPQYEKYEPDAAPHHPEEPQYEKYEPDAAPRHPEEPQYEKDKSDASPDNKKEAPLEENKSDALPHDQESTAKTDEGTQDAACNQEPEGKKNSKISSRAETNEHKPKSSPDYQQLLFATHKLTLTESFNHSAQGKHYGDRAQQKEDESTDEPRDVDIEISMHTFDGTYFYIITIRKRSFLFEENTLKLKSTFPNDTFAKNLFEYGCIKFKVTTGKPDDSIPGSRFGWASKRT